jgi:hypothetical protein
LNLACQQVAHVVGLAKERVGGKRVRAGAFFAKIDGPAFQRGEALRYLNRDYMFLLP